LGKIIESIVDIPIEQAQELFVFKPLDMINTVATKNYDQEKSVKFYSLKSKERKQAINVYNCSNYAGGCHLSTSEDLIKLGNTFLYPNRLLKKETIIELVNSLFLDDGTKTKYGKGFEISKDVFENFYFGHGGSAIAARSELKIYPNSKLVIVMLANNMKSKNDDLIANN
jgi:serine beta-lactamase-like protein LACTB